MAQQPQQVRLRLQKGDTIGEQITVAALAALQDKPGETWGFDPNAFVYKLVEPKRKDPPKSWTTKQRRLTVSSVYVGQEKVDIWPCVTAKVVDGNPVLDAKKIVFGERVRYTKGTGEPWFKGGDGTISGAYMRKLLERAGPDSEGELVKAAQKSVKPTQYEPLPDCHLVVCDVTGRYGGTQKHYCCRGAPDDADIREEAAIAAIGAALSYRNVPNIKEDSIYLKMSTRIQEATRKALEGKPWKEYKLADYIVANLPGERTTIDRKGKAHHFSATAEPRTFKSAPSRKVAHERGVKANPGAARNEEDRRKFIGDYNAVRRRRGLPAWDAAEAAPLTFAEAPLDQGRGKAIEALETLDGLNVKVTLYFRALGVANFIAAAPGAWRPHQKYFLGDDASVSRALRLETDEIWDDSLKEAVRTGTHVKDVFPRLAIARKLHLMVAAEAGYDLDETQAAAFTEYYGFGFMLKKGLASRASIVLALKVVLETANIESHVWTAFARDEYRLANENQQYTFKVAAIRAARKLRWEREGDSLGGGDVVTYVAARAVGVTDEDIALVAEQECDERVAEVAETLASLKGAAKAKYVKEVRALLDKAKEEMAMDAEENASSSDSDSDSDSGSGSNSSSDADSDAPPPPPKKKRRGPPPKKKRPPRATPSPSSSPRPSSYSSPLKERHQALSERLRSLGGRRGSR